MRLLNDRPRLDREKLGVIRDNPRLNRLLGVARQSLEGSVARRRATVETEPPPRRHTCMTGCLNRTEERVSPVYELEILCHFTP